MEKVNKLETRLCLVWTTQKAHLNGPRHSSSFELLDSEWNLQMTYTYDGHYSKNHFTLFLHQETKTKKLEKCFRVTAYIETEDHRFMSRLASSLVQLSEENTTHYAICHFKQEDLWRELSGGAYSAQWRLVCLFHGIQSSEFQSDSDIIHLFDWDDLELPVSIDLPPDVESLSHDFGKLLKDKSFPDVKLRCGDRTFDVHRAVLSARSAAFASMFRNKTLESDTGVVDITDVEAHVLDMLLKYLYSGKLLCSSEDALRSLYEASDKYGVYALRTTCTNRMITSLTKENCVNFLTLADVHDDLAFQNAVVSFICRREAILESEVWKNFSSDHPKLSNGIYERILRGNHHRVTKRLKINTSDGL